MTFAEDFFRALSDPTRLRCLALIAQGDEVCVCELTEALGLNQPKVSRHLAQLREARVVLDRRQGQWVYYRLAPSLPDWAVEVLGTVVRGLAGQEPFLSDRSAFMRMPGRSIDCCTTEKCDCL